MYTPRNSNPYGIGKQLFCFTRYIGKYRKCIEMIEIELV